MGLITTSHPDIKDYAKTALTATIAAAGATCTVENGLLFADNNYLLVDGYGRATSELVRVSGTPTATSITLVAPGVSFAHGIGTTLQFIPWNQVAIEVSTNLHTLWATNLYATLAEASDAATWAALVTTGLTVSNTATVYNDVNTGSRSYRTRFYNSQSGNYSGYSDPILPTGFEELAVGKIIRKALGRTNQTIGQEDTSLVTMEFMLDEVNNCLREVSARRKTWAFNQEFDYVLSEITAGVNVYALPRNIDYGFGTRDLFNVRVNDGADLPHIDKREYDVLFKSAHTTTITGNLTSASATIVLTDSSDFPDSGSFTAITDATKDTVTWTANNRTTNTLTLDSPNGVTAGVTHVSGTHIWYNGSFSDTPTSYTVFENSIYLYPVPDTGVTLRTLKIDYYKGVTEVDSENDYLIFPNPMLVVHYLCMAVSERMNRPDDAQRYELRYLQALKDLVRVEISGQKHYLSFRSNAPYFRRTTTNRTDFFS